MSAPPVSPEEPSSVSVGTAAQADATAGQALPGRALLGRSDSMRRTLALLARVAATDAAVLVQGEPGTGKTTAARMLHATSRRAAGPLVVLDCAAPGPTALGSALFGQGGAAVGVGGCLTRAAGGTLFLEDVDALAPELQARLQQTLEALAPHAPGAPAAPAAPRSANVRVVAASRVRLWAEVKTGRFREDLFFRLSVFTVELPPLRERPEDVPLLVDALAGAPLWEGLPEPLRERLLAHAWPGNVRELRNAVERALQLAGAPGAALEAWVPPAPGMEPRGEDGPELLPVDLEGPFKDSKDALLRRFERAYLDRALARSGGNVARAARAAGLDRKHLYSLLHKHGLVQGESGD